MEQDEIKWKRFTGQKLETTDLLLTSNGLAFVDSGYTDGTPSRISSIPEAWSFSFENGGINQRDKKGESYEFILPSGKYYYTTMRKRKKLAGQILYVCHITEPK